MTRISELVQLDVDESGNPIWGHVELPDLPRGQTVVDLGQKILDQRAAYNDAVATDGDVTTEVEYLAYLQTEGQRAMGAEEDYS